MTGQKYFFPAAPEWRFLGRRFSSDANRMTLAVKVRCPPRRGRVPPRAKTSNSRMLLLDLGIDDLHAPVLAGKRIGGILELRLSIADGNQGRRRQLELIDEQLLYRLGSAFR